MTGRLRTLGHILAIYASDLSDARATRAELDASMILNALHTAILLEESDARSLSSLAELAGLVRPWMSRELIEAVRALVTAQDSD